MDAMSGDCCGTVKQGFVYRLSSGECEFACLECFYRLVRRRRTKQRQDLLQKLEKVDKTE